MSFKRENSRAPARKRHDPQAFLTIGDPEDEIAIDADGFWKSQTAEGLANGNPKAAAGTAVRAASSRPTADSVAKAPKPDTAEYSGNAERGGAASASHSASTQRSSSRFNDSFASFERRAAATARGASRRSERRPLASPPTVGLYVRSPFKQDATRAAAAGSLPPAFKGAAVPGAELMEATLIATVEVDRAIREEVQRSRALLAADVGDGQRRAPRLLKAPMRPLEVVRLNTPTIAQCRGVQAAAAATAAVPRAAALSALISLEEGSRNDTRVKSSATSRPITETGSRQRSAVAFAAAAAVTATSSAPVVLSSQVPKSALRRTSAKRSADAQAKDSPAPRNSFDEETEEFQSEPQAEERSGVGERLEKDAASQNIAKPLFAAEHTHRPSSSAASAFAKGEAAPGADGRQRTPSSSCSGSGGGQLGRGRTFLTENAESPGRAASADLAPRAEYIESQRLSEKAADAATDESPEQVKRRSEPPGDLLHDGAPSRMGRGETVTLAESAPVDRERFAVIGADDAAPRTLSSAASGAIASVASRGREERPSPSSLSLSLSSAATPTAHAGEVDVKATVETASRRAGSGGRSARCKEPIDDDRRPEDDDDDKGSGGGGGGGRSNASRMAVVVIVGAAAAGGERTGPASGGSAAGNGGSRAAGDSGEGKLLACGIDGTVDQPLVDNERLASLEAQLSAVIADLRRQRSKYDGLFVVDQESASSSIDDSICDVRSVWDEARLVIGSAGTRSGGCESEPAVAADAAWAGNKRPSLSLHLCSALEESTAAAEGLDDAILLNRDHRVDDIYEDLFYHSWGADNLTPSCLSRHLTGRRPRKGTECVSHQKESPAVRRPAWEEQRSWLSAALEMKQPRPSDSTGEERAATSMNPNPRCPGEAIAFAACAASELCVRPASATGSTEKWVSRSASYTPPPLCFDINARPPAGHFYYFAYGMHMNAGRLGASLGRTVDDFRLWGLLFGFQLIFNKRGVDKQAGLFPNIEYNPHASVEGCVYRLSAAELPLLDAYHGYPLHYARAVLPVWVVNCLDPDNYGIAQHCVPAVAYVAQDNWLNDAACRSDKSARDYSLRQCLKSADLLTSNYKKQLLLMCSRQ